MATMSLDNEIKKYLPLLVEDKKRSILSDIKSFLTLNVKNEGMTKKEFIIQYNKELDEADKRISAGFYISQEDLEKESENWKDEA
jgi:hypothetical protein